MKILVTYLCLLLGFTINSQNGTFSSHRISVNPLIDGTLVQPDGNATTPLVILIPDTGPTDRNGNQNFQNSDALKKLAEGLAAKKIASFRYDKRIVKQLRKGFVDPKISFDNFIEDAIAVINFFKERPNFSKIYIIGHGQGSLVGMLASRNEVDGFISIAGSGKSIDEVILDQIEITDKSLLEPAQAAFSELKKGRKTRQYPPALQNIFSLDTQSFMMSWMQYDPKKVVQDISIPCLFISGTKDLQVPVEETQMLFENSQHGTIKIVDQMNHVLTIIEGDDLENSKSYNEAFRAISSELLDHITEFVLVD